MGRLTEGKPVQSPKQLGLLTEQFPKQVCVCSVFINTHCAAQRSSARCCMAALFLPYASC